MNMSLIGDLSAVATMILFLFYFVGRVVTIISIRKIWRDKVVVDLLDYSQYEIIDEVGFDLEEDIHGVIISKEGIRDLKVFEVVPNSDGLMTKKGRLIYSNQFINIDQSIAIRCCTGDLFPTLIIEYVSFDYMKVKIEWRDNLKSGVLSELVVPKHTVKSFLYYLLK